MAIRQFLRETVSEPQLSAIATEVAERFGDSNEEVGNSSDGEFERLEADNWLSVPLVVDERWFVKVIGDGHTVVHAILTTGRNLGAFSSGTMGFFERFSTPIEMAQHELEAARRMRELGVAAPEPIATFEREGFGVVVFEYLPSFRTLDELPSDRAEAFAPTVFEYLATMHEDGIAHGDLRAENVLVAPDDSGVDTLYFIDATRVREGAMEDAKAYDVACALASLAPAVGARTAVAAALESYPVRTLLDAREFLDFVCLRPDHDFDAASVKGEIERVAA